MLARLKRLWRRPPADALPSQETASAPAEPLPTFGGDLEAIGLTTAGWCRRRREGGSLYTNISPDALEKLRDACAGRARATSPQRSG